MASTASAAEPYPSNLPLTPGESDHEDTSQSPVIAERKRNAGEMVDDVEKSNTSKVGQSESMAASAAVTETIEAEVSPDFTIECPLRRKRRLKRKRSSVPEVQDNVYIEQDAPVLAPSLRIEYAVRPVNEWLKLEKYKNAK
ncbi:hypothetical protein LTR46_011774, partial [Exophiala xenobiotica]